MILKSEQSQQYSILQKAIKQLAIQYYNYSMSILEAQRLSNHRIETKDPSPIKKKKTQTIKLPSVKGSQIQNGNYILGEIIGEGGFAKVRICKRKTDNELFVIKIFQKFRLNTEEKKKSIKKQIEIMKCIRHSSVIRIFDYFQTQETINIVMEYFSIVSLAQYARQERPIDNQHLRQIVKQIADGLQYLHNNKIAHRDLKPQNILINKKREIKIIDLGLSLRGDQQEVKVAGTPYYMSPELLNKKNYDPYKADIWAFGILLYWVILGYFPQDTQQKEKKKKKIQKLFNLKFPVDMHPGIQYLISKMLHQDPADRINACQILDDTWVTPKDFKNEINKLIKGLSKVNLQ